MVLFHFQKPEFKCKKGKHGGLELDYDFNNWLLRFGIYVVHVTKKSNNPITKGNRCPKDVPYCYSVSKKIKEVVIHEEFVTTGGLPTSTSCSV